MSNCVSDLFYNFMCHNTEGWIWKRHMLLTMCLMSQEVLGKEENVAIYRRNIVYRRVSTRYFMEKYRSDDISGFIARNRWFITIYRWFFFDISRGQCGSTKVRPATVPINALQCLHICLLPRGFEPQTKRFGIHPLTTWAKFPFDT